MNNSSGQLMYKNLDKELRDMMKVDIYVYDCYLRDSYLCTIKSLNKFINRTELTNIVKNRYPRAVWLKDKDEFTFYRFFCYKDYLYKVLGETA